MLLFLLLCARVRWAAPHHLPPSPSLAQPTPPTSSLSSSESRVRWCRSQRIVGTYFGVRESVGGSSKHNVGPEVVTICILTARSSADAHDSIAPPRERIVAAGRRCALADRLATAAHRLHPGATECDEGTRRTAWNAAWPGVQAVADRACRALTHRVRLRTRADEGGRRWGECGTWIEQPPT